MPLRNKLIAYYKRATRRGINPTQATIDLWNQKILGRKSPDKINSRLGHNRFDLPFLVSYPRSGLNLIRYFLETVSGQPTPGQVRNKSGTNFIIDRTHYGYERMKQYEKVILLLRNYKECIIREHSIEFIRSYETLDDFLQDDTIASYAKSYGLY
jgi:hypothetical protein